jgi:acetyltransferase-like isoleucine patch superfamily enzyme
VRPRTVAEGNAVHPVLVLRKLQRAWRQVVYDLFGGKRTGRVLLGPRLEFDPRMDLTLEGGCVLSRDGTFSGTGRVRIGERTYLGPFFSIQCVGEVTIGRDCLFGNFVSLIDNDHARAADATIASQPLEAAPIRIGDDCWLGEKSIVLRGVTIGSHAIVAAGALVREDVAPYDIVAGVPARVVGKRT